VSANPAALGPPPPLGPRIVAIFADLDGTLAPIRPRPEDVGPDAARAQILERLRRSLGGALAVVSGRALADIDRILAGGVVAVSAVHGLSRRRADGGLDETGDIASLPAAVREAARAYVAGRPGLTAEDKGVAIALHYRAAPAAEAACRVFAKDLAARFGLKLQPGAMVFELRAPGPSKGDALAAFMAEPPFAGRMPIFVGDDLTDEDGFAAAERFGGFGVIVGPRRPTLARYALADPAGALDWLASASLCPPPLSVK
jgi:trehalose 6-phosphate phosphatase